MYLYTCFAKDPTRTVERAQVRLWAKLVQKCQILRFGLKKDKLAKLCRRSILGWPVKKFLYFTVTVTVMYLWSLVHGRPRQLTPDFGSRCISETPFCQQLPALQFLQFIQLPAAKRAILAIVQIEISNLFRAHPRRFLYIIFFRQAREKWSIFVVYLILHIHNALIYA